jgi:regulator of sirC expression with transglutaminase-like and TPR domain
MKTKLTRVLIPSCLIILATWLADMPASLADQSRLRVVYADVSATERLESGELYAGIEELWNRLENSEPEEAGGILATLCAAYIVDNAVDEAKRVCDEAVKRNPTKVALNNRGVYRAVTGDLDGARADFRRVRPEAMDEYLREMRKKDVPLVATDNLALVERAIDTRRTSRKSGVAEARIVSLDAQRD